MAYRLIEKGTMFNLEFRDRQTEDSVTQRGFLFEPASDIVMFLEGDALYDYCSALPEKTPVSLTYHRGEKEFAFDGRYDMVLKRGEHKLTEVTAIGVMKESSRRSTRRFLMTLDVSLYGQRDNDALRASLKGQSYDISCDSMSIWSNDNTDDLSATFYAGFTLFNKENFNLPAKILRKKNAPNSSFFRYEYILLFDYSSDMKEKYRLLDTFIKKTLESGRL